MGGSNPGTPANSWLRTPLALAEVFDTTVKAVLPKILPKIAVGRELVNRMAVGFQLESKFCTAPASMPMPHP